MSQFDIVIIGAGVAGSALAFALGRMGYKILLIERSLKEPNRIVGELLQPGGVLLLHELGLEGCIEGIDGIEVEGYGIMYNGEHQKLKYPLVNQKEIRGKSFHHGRFIQKLREAARSVSSVTVVEALAINLISDDEGVCGVKYKEQDTEKECTAALTLVCDGCSSNFRKFFSMSKPVTKSHFVGVLLNDCKLPYERCGNVILASPGPVLSYQIGSNEVRVLVDLPDPLPKSVPQYLLEVTAPQLPESIQTAFIKSVKEKGFKSMANSLLHAAESVIQPGVVCVGDSWNMRHPLTGGGMTVALNDTVLLRNLLRDCDLSNRATTATRLKQYFEQRKPVAASINILSFALYSVFAASDDPMLPAMRQACWDYFKFGGACVSGPMSLLSALNPSPRTLVYHFFLVGIYGSIRSLWPPYPSNISKAYKVLRAASWIVIPLLKGEKVYNWFATLLSIVFWRKQASQHHKQS